MPSDTGNVLRKSTKSKISYQGHEDVDVGNSDDPLSLASSPPRVALRKKRKTTEETRPSVSKKLRREAGNVPPPARATPIVPGRLASVPSTDDIICAFTSLLDGPSFIALEKSLIRLGAACENITPSDLGLKGRSHKNQTSPESSQSKGHHEPTASRIPSEPEDFAKPRKGAPMPGRVVTIEAGSSRPIPTAEPNRRSSDARREGDEHRRNKRDRRPVSQRPAAGDDTVKLKSVGVPTEDQEPYVPSTSLSSEKKRPKKQLPIGKNATPQEVNTEPSAPVPTHDVGSVHVETERRLAAALEKVAASEGRAATSDRLAREATDRLAEAQAALERTELELKTALQENVRMRECWTAEVAWRNRMQQSMQHMPAPTDAFLQ